MTDCARETRWGRSAGPRSLQRLGHRSGRSAAVSCAMRPRAPLCRSLAPLLLLASSCAGVSARQPGATTAPAREEQAAETALRGAADAARAPIATAASSLGRTKASAIEVCAPAGERAYLRCLVCADGTTLSFERSGSVGPRTEPRTEEESRSALQQILPGPLDPAQPDFHIVDRYRVRCGEQVSALFFDMYHCGGASPGVPDGFQAWPDCLEQVFPTSEEPPRSSRARASRVTVAPNRARPRLAGWLPSEPRAPSIPALAVEWTTATPPASAAPSSGAAHRHRRR